MDLTDEQWRYVERFIPPDELEQPASTGGRPWRPARDVLNGVLWVLRTGAQWVDLPRRYPPSSTCHRRYQRWVKEGVMERLLRALAEDLLRRGKLDLTECFIDGTHAGAKKGALLLGRLDAAKRPRSWQWQTAMVFLSPLGLRVVSEVKSASS